MKEFEGKPAVGESSCMLGARPTDLGRENDAADDPVEPLKAGLSVGGCIRTTYLNYLPQRLQLVYPEWARGAKGNNSHKVWAMGEGAYEAGPVSPDLDLRFKTNDRLGHGLIAPNREVPLQEYQTALAATLDHWQEDEKHIHDCPVCKKFGIS